jgi:predicted Zn-dependent peptidase
MPQASEVERRAAQVHRLTNGLVLLAEPVESVESAAFTLLIECGCAGDPADRLGLSNLLCDMVLRGAGDRDSRALIGDLENLGVERGESVGASQTSFSGATLADNLLDALAIYADVVRRPRLPADQLEAGRQVCLQEISGAEDEPSQKLIEALRRRSYPEPWGRPSHGDEAGVLAATLDDVRRHWRRTYRPKGAILAVAGKIEWPRLVAAVEEIFGDWAAGEVDPPQELPGFTTKLHAHYDSNQCHVGIAYPSVPYRDERYLEAWAAVGVLSGGMSSRLFTEVREKRGLCYSVSASLQSQLTRARVLCYAGTTAERAQETLDVTYAEINRLARGVERGELDRLKARIKSGLIMQQESTSSRSGSLARDWRHLGRIRSLDDLSREIDALTVERINRYLADHPPSDFTFATLGPHELAIPA